MADVSVIELSSTTLSSKLVALVGKEVARQMRKDAPARFVQGRYLVCDYTGDSPCLMDVMYDVIGAGDMGSDHLDTHWLCNELIRAIIKLHES